MTFSARRLLPLSLAIAALCGLILVRHVLLPFVLAATLAYLLNPLVGFWEVRGVRRQAAVMVIFALFLAGILLSLYFCFLAAGREVAQARLNPALWGGMGWPTSVSQSQGLLSWGNTLLQPLTRSPLGQTLVRQLEVYGRPWLVDLWPSGPALAQHILPLLELTVLIPFLAFFFMLGGPGLRDTLLQGISARYVEMLLNVFVEIDNSLGQYLRGLCLESLFMGVLAGAGFWLIGLDYAVRIALWVALSSMIPLLGPVSAAVVGGAVALFQWGSLIGVAKVILVCLAIRLADDSLLQPLIMRRAVHLHPVLVVFSLMTGWSLFGFWGLVFAVPAACMIKVLLEVALSWYRSQYRRTSSAAIPLDVSRVPVV